MIYKSVADEVLACAQYLISIVKPSDWNEQNRVLTADISAIPGPLSYDNSPYTREIVDFFAPDHPGRIVAIMKAAQVGFSTTVIEAAIGWIISQCPGPILYTVGHEDLVQDSMKKIDRMLDNSGTPPLRTMIRSTVKRARNSKSGDTDYIKEFPLGYLKLGMVNHKTLRNISMMYGFIDDFDGVKSFNVKSGSTRKMIEQRFAAFAKKMKLAYISSPELKETSNIEPVYLLGDQRKYHLPCPKCEKKIALFWTVPSEKYDGKTAGIKWDTNPDGTLIAETVRYQCQICGEDFDDKNKMELMRLGNWVPTAKPSEPGYYSYHISALYATNFMYDWTHYVRDFMEAYPANKPPDQELVKTFYNLCLGETYSPPSIEIKSTQLMANIRKYKIGIVPEKQSINDGNGKIVLLTLVADLGGLMTGYNSDHDDARLHWELSAWSETGSEYKVDAGTIGTFTPSYHGKRNPDRRLWTYDISKPFAVWKIFEEIRQRRYQVDTGHLMSIGVTAIDTGFAERHAFNYIDRANGVVIGIKGDKDHKYTSFGDNSASWRESQERARLYLLKVSKLKDQMAQRVTLKWDRALPAPNPQPPGFINFPQPADGKYDPTEYFAHFEAEERKVDPKTNNFIWMKKSSHHENHYFDTSTYGMVSADIMMENTLKQLKIVNGTWKDFANWVLSQRK